MYLYPSVFYTFIKIGLFAFAWLHFIFLIVQTLADIKLLLDPHRFLLPFYE